MMLDKVVCWGCGEEEVEQCGGCGRWYCQSCRLFHDCPALLKNNPTPGETEAAMELVLQEDIFFMDALLKVRRASCDGRPF